MVLIPVFFLVLCFVGAIYVSRLLSRARHRASLKKSVEPGAADSARAALIQAVEKDPADCGSRISLAKSYMDGKNYDEAYKLYSILRQSDPDALPMFKTVLSRRPDDVESNYYLGQIYVNYQNYKAAYNHFLKSKNGGAYAAKSLRCLFED